MKMKRAMKKALLALVMLAAGGALAYTHSIGNGNDLSNLLSGQQVNGKTLADGDVIEITNDFTTGSSVTITKKVTIRSAAGGPVRTIFVGPGHYFQIGSSASLTTENITFDGEMLPRSAGLFYIASGATNAGLSFGEGTTICNIDFKSQPGQSGVYGQYSAIRVLSPSATLTLDGAAITNCHSYSAAGAINTKCPTTISNSTISGCSGGAGTESAGAIYTTGTLSLSGNVTIANNTAGGAVCNIRPSANNLIRLAGNMTGSVGVTYPSTPALGAHFGTFASGTGASHFFCDTNPSFRGEVSGSTLVWGEAQEEELETMLLRGEQRYPWNNLVDIDYYLKEDATNARLVFTMTNEETGETVTLQSFVDNANTNQVITLGGTPALRAPGLHRITWNANADGVAVLSRNVTYRLHVCMGVER